MKLLEFKVYTGRRYHEMLGHCQISYVVRDGHDTFYYCLQQVDKKSMRLMRCSKDFETMHEVKEFKKGITAIFEYPPRELNRNGMPPWSELEKLAAEWIDAYRERGKL